MFVSYFPWFMPTIADEHNHVCLAGKTVKVHPGVMAAMGGFPGIKRKAFILYGLVMADVERSSLLGDTKPFSLYFDSPSLRSFEHYLASIEKIRGHILLASWLTNSPLSPPPLK